MSSEEAARLTGEGNSLQVGDADSELSKLTFGKFGGLPEGAERQKVVQQDIARDFAVALKKAPQALLYSLGKNAGLSYDQSMSGELNISLPSIADPTKQERIKDVDALMKWIKEVNGTDEAAFNKRTQDTVAFKDDTRTFNDMDLRGFEATIKKQLEASKRAAPPQKGGNGAAGGVQDDDES